MRRKHDRNVAGGGRHLNGDGDGDGNGDTTSSVVHVDVDSDYGPSSSGSGDDAEHATSSPHHRTFVSSPSSPSTFGVTAETYPSTSTSTLTATATAMSRKLPLSLSPRRHHAVADVVSVPLSDVDRSPATMTNGGGGGGVVRGQFPPAQLMMPTQTVTTRSYLNSNNFLSVPSPAASRSAWSLLRPRSLSPSAEFASAFAPSSSTFAPSQWTPHATSDSATISCSSPPGSSGHGQDGSAEAYHRNHRRSSSAHFTSSTSSPSLSSFASSSYASSNLPGSSSHRQRTTHKPRPPSPALTQNHNHFHNHNHGHASSAPMASSIFTLRLLLLGAVVLFVLLPIIVYSALRPSDTGGRGRDGNADGFEFDGGATRANREYGNDSRNRSDSRNEEGDDGSWSAAAHDETPARPLRIAYVCDPLAPSFPIEHPRQYQAVCEAEAEGLYQLATQISGCLEFFVIVPGRPPSPPRQQRANARPVNTTRAMPLTHRKPVLWAPPPTDVEASDDTESDTNDALILDDVNDNDRDQKKYPFDIVEIGVVGQDLQCWMTEVAFFLLNDLGSEAEAPPDVIWCHGTVCPRTFAQANSSIPVIATLHYGTNLDEVEQLGPWFRYRLLSKAIQKRWTSHLKFLPSTAFALWQPLADSDFDYHRMQKGEYFLWVSDCQLRDLSGLEVAALLAREHPSRKFRAYCYKSPMSQILAGFALIQQDYHNFRYMGILTANKHADVFAKAHFFLQLGSTLGMPFSVPVAHALAKGTPVLGGLEPLLMEIVNGTARAGILTDSYYNLHGSVGGAILNRSAAFHHARQQFGSAGVVRGMLSATEALIDANDVSLGRFTLFDSAWCRPLVATMNERVQVGMDRTDMLRVETHSRRERERRRRTKKKQSWWSSWW